MVGHPTLGLFMIFFSNKIAFYSFLKNLFSIFKKSLLQLVLSYFPKAWRFLLCGLIDRPLGIQSGVCPCNYAVFFPFDWGF